MRNVRLFENFDDDSDPICYMIATDENLLEKDPSPRHTLKLFTLCATTESQALGFLYEALGGSSEGPYMDPRTGSKEIESVLGMIIELNGLNGTWKIYDFPGQKAPIGMHEIEPIQPKWENI